MPLMSSFEDESRSLLETALTKINAGVAGGSSASSPPLVLVAGGLDSLVSAVPSASEQRILEWKQVLTELGYLSSKDEFSGEVDAAFVAALTGLANDCETSAATRRLFSTAFPANTALAGGSGDGGGTGGSVGPIHTWLNRNEKSLDLISEALGLGDQLPLFSAKSLLAGEKSFRTRVLHAQMQRMGLYAGVTSAPVADATLSGLAMFARMIAPQGENVPPSGALSPAFVQDMCQKVGRLEVVLSAVLSKSTKRTIRPVRAYVYVFMEKVHATNLGHLEKSSYKIPGLGFGRAERERALEDLLYGPENKLLARLTQLWLSCHGFYGGFMDGVLAGSFSEGMESFIESLSIDPEDVLTEIAGSAIGVNVSLLFDRLIEFDKAAVKAERSRTYEEAKAAADLYGKAMMREESSEETTRSWWHKLLQGGRRIFRSARHIVRYAVLWAKRTLLWLASAIDRAFRSVRDFVRSVIASGHRVLNIFVGLLRPLLHFLLRRPLVTTGAEGSVLFSDTDLDRDMLTYAAPSARAADVVLHSDRLKWLVAAYEFALAFFMVLLRLGLAIAQGPVGWVRAVWVLADVALNWPEDKVDTLIDDGRRLFT